LIELSKEKIAELDEYYNHPNNLVDLFEDSVVKWGDKNAFGTKNLKTREYEWVTYTEVAERVKNLRGGLKNFGFNEGEAIGVIVKNSVEWFIIENATHGLQGVYVPMYENELIQTWEYIIKDSGLRYLFVKDEEIFEKVKHLKEKTSTLEEIFIIYGDGENSMDSLETKGKDNPADSLKPHWSKAAELIYTSGTTGDPKGVVLSHGNLTACSKAGYHIYPDLDENSVSLAILPWAHSYGLSAELHNFLQFGGAIGLMESVDTLGDDFLSVKPTYLIAVPRVFNKIYDGIHAKMKEEGGLKKKLFDSACIEAVKYRDSEKTGLKLKILDKLVFSKIRERFGGRLMGVMTASALMNPDIALFFKDIGIPTFDCYGLTETSPAITMNSPLKGNKYGSVGKCVENMHVKIDTSIVNDGSGEGEIVAYGAHIMMGYYNKPNATKTVITEDSWNGFPGFRTGDKGHIDEEGYLFVTGRFKDEYKLSNGKYVHPESIETDIKLLPHVANAMIFGDGKQYNVCIIVPDFEVLRSDPDTSDMSKPEPEDLIENSEFKDFMINEVNQHLRKSFGGYEIPKKYIFTADDFSLENSMLTPTMKLKRREVLKVYGEDLNKLYS